MSKKNAKKPILIFDFDGTIADSHRYIIDICNRLAQEFNYKKIPPEDIELIKDKTAKEMLNALNIPMLKVPIIITKAKKEFYAGISNIEPIEGLKEVLIKLKSNNIQMGILSSNNQKNIMTFLNIHGLNDIFEFIHSTSKIWTKNTALKRLIKKYNFAIKDILYIGDETRDITAAQKINAKIAAVSWGYNSADILKKYNPDYILHKPTDLLNIVY